MCTCSLGIFESFVSPIELCMCVFIHVCVCSLRLSEAMRHLLLCRKESDERTRVKVLLRVYLCVCVCQCVYARFAVRLRGSLYAYRVFVPVACVCVCACVYVKGAHGGSVIVISERFVNEFRTMYNKRALDEQMDKLVRAAPFLKNKGKAVCALMPSSVPAHLNDSLAHCVTVLITCRRFYIL